MLVYFQFFSVAMCHPVSQQMKKPSASKIHPNLVLFAPVINSTPLSMEPRVLSVSTNFMWPSTARPHNCPVESEKGFSAPVLVGWWLSALMCGTSLRCSCIKEHHFKPPKKPQLHARVLHSDADREQWVKCCEVQVLQVSVPHPGSQE